MSATQTRRSALRETLIELAEQRIAADGLAALKARDLAAEAGCALGAIYTVFPDMTALVLEVNARTFGLLGAAVAAALAGSGPDPTAQMLTMGRAYHHYAAANLPRWRAVFDVPLPPGERPPDWYLGAMERLFDMIARPVAQMFPAMPAADRHLLTRALFSAVHGIVLMTPAIGNSAAPQADTDRMIALLLGQVARGAAGDP